jgi:hypothetical protein
MNRFLVSREYIMANITTPNIRNLHTIMNGYESLWIIKKKVCLRIVMNRKTPKYESFELLSTQKSLHVNNNSQNMNSYASLS